MRYEDAIEQIEACHILGVRAVAQGRMTGMELLELDATLERERRKAEGQRGARARDAALRAEAAQGRAKAAPAFAAYLRAKIPAKSRYGGVSA